MKSKSYTQNKRPLDKIQSSKLCQLGVKRTRFQNLKEKKKLFFDHSTTFKENVSEVARSCLIYLQSYGLYTLDIGGEESSLG